MRINGFISTAMLIVLLLIAILGGITHAENEEDWMPDPHLRQAVREALDIPDEIPMLPADMTELYGLFVEHDIKNLKGLEYAINLEFLHISRTEVSDLTPLSELQNLHALILYNNRISDITPLSELIELRELHLQNNFISDLTPLVNLTNLEILTIDGNPIPRENQFIGIEVPHLKAVIDAAICDMPSPSYTATVTERLNNRDYPSVFLSHKRSNYEQDPEPFEQLVHYDFSFMFEPFHPLSRGRFFNSPFGGTVRSMSNLLQIHRDTIHENPNMIFIVSIAYYNGGQGFNFLTIHLIGSEIRTVR